MKLRNIILIIIAVLFVDQALKIYIKLNYPIGDTHLTGGLSWFRLHFIENSGMAWGWKFGNETGKTILTLFRLVAVIVGSWYIVKLVKEKYSKGLLVCAALIYAGALGNLIDSLFYGLIFDKGLHYDAALGNYTYYEGIAKFSSDGYSSFLHGSVVDMLYFPIINSTWPNWVPFVGGEPFEFFSPIFNIADASISVGVIALLLFQKRFMRKETDNVNHSTVQTNSTVSDETQVL